MSSMWTSSPEWRARAARLVRLDRDAGWSYEEIAAWMPDRNDEVMTPWEVYELANPSKSAGQVAAWKQKHHPNG